MTSNHSFDQSWYPWAFRRLQFGDDHVGHTVGHDYPMFASSGRQELRIVIDVNVIESQSSFEATRRLLEIVNVSPVRAFAFGEGEPPEDFERFRVGFFDHELVSDWLSLKRSWRSIENSVFYPDKDDMFDASKISVVEHSYQLLDPEIGRGTFSDSASDFGLVDRYPDETWEESVWPARRKGWIGMAPKTDLLVTRDEALLREAEWFRAKVSIVTPEQALPLVALFLRSRSIYAVRSLSNLGDRYKYGAHVFSRSLYFEVASQGLLREIWPLLKEIVKWPTKPGDIVELAELTATMRRRLQTILRVRDDLLVTLSVPQDTDTIDDTVVHFDHICLLLKGVIDALAGVVHTALNISGNVKKASWTFPEWVSKVERVVDSNGTIVGKDAPGIAAVKILSALRNTIHEIGVGSTIFLPSTGESRQKIPYARFSIPQKRMTAIEATLLGNGCQYWGIDMQQWDQDKLSPVVLPGQYIERMIREILLFVRQVVHMIAAHGQALTIQPEESLRLHDVNNPNSPEMQDRIIWQLGMNDLLATSRR